MTKVNLNSSSRLLGLCLTCVALVFLVGLSRQYFTESVQIIKYPYGLDYAEGPLMEQVTDLKRGKQIYNSIDNPPYTVSNYPPFYHLVVAGLSYHTESLLTAGRLVSFLSVIITALLIMLWVFGSSETRPWPALLGAACAALLFLTVLPTKFGYYMRVDAFACMLGFIGLSIISLGPSSITLVFSVLFFVLALLTKQTAVAAAGAVMLLALRARSRLFWQVLAGILVVLSTTALAGVILFPGEYFFNLVTANRNEMLWMQLYRYFSMLGELYPVIFLIAFLVGVLALSFPTIAGGKWLRRPLNRMHLLTSYMAAALVVSLSAAKIGSYLNYFIEPMIPICALTGIAIAKSLSGNFNDLFRGRSAFLSWLGAVIIPSALVYQLVRAPSLQPFHTIETTQEQDIGKLLAKIRDQAEPILSEEMSFLPLAGKRIYLQPFEMNQLAKQGIWDQSALIESIKQREFSLVVLKFKLDQDALTNPLVRERFSPEAVAAFGNHYLLREELAGYYLYQPKP